MMMSYPLVGYRQKRGLWHYAFAEKVPLVFNAQLPDASGWSHDLVILSLRERRLHLTQSFACFCAWPLRSFSKHLLL